MSDAVFLLKLRSRNLEVAAEFELAVDNVVNGISTPIQRVVGAAAWTAAAAPLIRKQYLGTIVVEGGGVPISES